MRFVRFTTGSGKEELKAILDAGHLRQIYGSFLQSYTQSDNVYDAENAAYLPPVLPANIICMASKSRRTYIKSPSTVSGDGAEVSAGNSGGVLSYVPRIAYVVKNRDHSKEFGFTLFGWTLMLDFSLSGDEEGLSHSFEKYTLLGKSVNSNLSEITAICAAVNGKQIYQAPHIFNPDTIKSLSQKTTLQPGDVIAFLPDACTEIACHAGDVIALIANNNERLEAKII